MPNFELLRNVYACDKPKLLKTIIKKTDPNELRSEMERLDQSWNDESTAGKEYGHSIHSMEEKRIRMIGFCRDFRNKHFTHIPLPKRKWDNYLYSTDAADYSNGVYTELLLTYHRVLCGTSDRVLVEDRFVGVEDYKTNETFSTKSYLDPCNEKYQYLKYPFHNVQDCELGIYSIQITTYALMLETYGFKIDPDRLYLIHRPNPRYKKYHKCLFLKKEVEKALLMFL